jgi:hypothetical protein
MPPKQDPKPSRARSAAVASRKSRWAVYPSRKRAERIGSVEARDQEEALEKTYSELNIPERDRFRVSVQRE